MYFSPYGYRNELHQAPYSNRYFPFLPFLAGLAVGPILFQHGHYDGPYYGPTYGPHYGPSYGPSHGPSYYGQSYNMGYGPPLYGQHDGEQDWPFPPSGHL
ncbi:penicillin-binding protein [Salibacterium salarium]|uniref:penicillin-binding protein n=1 Tax=Salibacterium salarium TaxID=284579 RepID=UPI0027D7F2D3|nr:penicillin-binding protein [Salibacterium salarium]